MEGPSAKFSSPNIPEKIFMVNPNDPHYQSTNGRTTGPSDYVLNAGQVDKDKPSDPKMDPLNPNSPTYLSQLRMQLTGLQDDINDFLTEQMEIAKNKRPKTQETVQKSKKKVNEFGEEELVEEDAY